MKFICSIALVFALPFLVGCADFRLFKADTTPEKAELSNQDRDLQIAVDVVVARLRQVEENDDWRSIEPLGPQIYQLATALLPANRVLQPLPVPPKVPAVLLPVVPAAAVATKLPVLLPLLSNATDGAAQVLPVLLAEKPDANIPLPPKLNNARSLYFAVQIGSYRSSDRALAGWRELQRQAPMVFTGLRARVERVDLGAKGVFVRLKAGPLSSRSEALSHCQTLQTKGISCIKADFTGVDQY